MIQIFSDIKRFQKQLMAIDDGIHTGIKHGAAVMAVAVPNAVIQECVTALEAVLAKLRGIA